MSLWMIYVLERKANTICPIELKGHQIIILVSNTTPFSNCFQIMILIIFVKSLASNKQKTFYRMNCKMNK